MSNKSIPQVLEELAQRHPELLPHVEQERNWLWLTADLTGEANKPLRESIGRAKPDRPNGIGFQFAPRGHTLPSGKVSHWAHHANHPIRYKRQDKSPNGASASDAGTHSANISDEALLAALT